MGTLVLTLIIVVLLITEGLTSGKNDDYLAENYI
jgi:hypothetical protein